MQEVVYPILMHGLTPDGMDSIEDGLDCIAMLIYYQDTGVKLTPAMWLLFPMMLHVVGGAENDVDGGFAFEYLNLATVCIQNYIAKDPLTLMSVGAGQTVTYMELTYKFI